uniref:Alternative protein MAP3K6 n=1 Tax=Homo sapiens TaxID=9606 RepID=L8ECB4_HUMAN|nr:alternative protein MAP3K6 [Homo sapiens]
MQAFCGAWLMGWYRLEWGPRPCSLPWWAGLPACWRPHPQTLVAISGRPFGGTSGRRGSGSVGHSCGRSWLACSGDWTAWSC